MRKFIVFVLLLIVSTASFSQPATNPAPTGKTDYLKKSGNQKFVAWVLLGGGTAVLTITGLSNVGLNIDGPKNSSSAVPVGIAAVCMVSSIPFFIASAKNKRRAMSISFKNETVPQIQNGSFTNHPVPSLTVKIFL